MSSSYTNINIHIIFHTKYYGLTIKEEDLSEVFHYIGGLIRTLSGVAYKVGGRPDHIHILASLPITESISDFVRNIKANSSRWIKGLHVYYKNFAWQKGYGAFSVSESNKSTVVNYINNQKEHHRKVSTMDEFCMFLQKNGLVFNPIGVVNDGK